MRNIVIYICFSVFLVLSNRIQSAPSCCEQYDECRKCLSQCYYSYPESPFYRYRYNKEEKSSQSFMFFHPASQNIEMRDSLWHNFLYNKHDNQAHAFQLIALYQDSIDSKATAKYFLPFEKCDDDPVRFVAGDDAGINNQDSARLRQQRDIRAEWLGLPSNFSGYFSINPHQRQAGFILEYHTDLEQFFCNIDFLKGFWVSVSIPVIGVENNLHFQQFNIRNPGTTFPHDLKEAFCQPSWHFAKICCARSTIGIAEVNIRAGRAYHSQNHTQLVYYSGISIPATTRQNSEYLFDSYLGYNGHLGMEAGLNTQILCNRDPSCYAFCFFADLETIFMFNNKQCRTFDLKCKPWSRYLPFVRKCGQPDQICPGVNVLTMQMRVNPFNFVNLAAGWRIKSEHLEFELGYALWGHGNERLEFMHDWNDITGYTDWGIAGTYDENTQNAVTASRSTIQCQAANDDEFVAIGQCDIDLDSGRARSAINHKAYFSLGALHAGCRVDAFFGGGAFAELAQLNTSLNRWGFWLKCGAIF